MFLAVNMNFFGRQNVRKHKKIKGSDKYVTLDISFKFDMLNKMKITSLESKENLEISWKGLITFLSFKDKARPQKYKKRRYPIGNFSKKDLYKIIRDFEKISQFSQNP